MEVVPDADLDARLVAHQLHQVVNIEGVLGCALVDATNGTLLACEQRAGPDLGRAATAWASVMRAQAQAAQHIGSTPVDELCATAGSHQQLMRKLSNHPDLFLLALLDRTRANAALARFRMMEAEKNLA